MRHRDTEGTEAGRISRPARKITQTVLRENEKQNHDASSAAACSKRKDTSVPSVSLWRI